MTRGCPARACALSLVFLCCSVPTRESVRGISRVSIQNGVSLLYIMLEIHPSIREPSNFACSAFALLKSSFIITVDITYFCCPCCCWCFCCSSSSPFSFFFSFRFFFLFFFFFCLIQMSSVSVINAIYPIISINSSSGSSNNNKTTNNSNNDNS